MDWTNYCPTDGNLLVPPPAAWRENQLEYDKRMKYATCPTCHKTKRELHRLDEAEPSQIVCPVRPVPPAPSALQKNFKKFVSTELANLQDQSKYLMPDLGKQRELKDKYYRQRFAS